MMYDVFIFQEGELISLDVVVPKEHVGEFIFKFGEKFAFAISDEQKVDWYYSRVRGRHIRVGVAMKRKNQLYAFIRNFCKEKNLSFGDDEA